MENNKIEQNESMSDVQNSIELQRRVLENGNTLVTYPNGVEIEETLSGKKLWQGDISLSPEQFKILTRTSATRGMITSDFLYLWPGGVIFYMLEGLNSTMEADVLRAMKIWEDNTPVIFRELYPEDLVHDPFYITIRKSDNLSSPTGISKGDYIDIPHLYSIGDILHELGHTIGLDHEQCRPDRDQYVTVYMDNIKSDYRRWYMISPADTCVSTFQFDYDSIMIYESSAFAINPSKPTMTKKDGSLIKRAQSLSPLDIEGVKLRYGRIKISGRPICSLSGSVVGSGKYYGDQPCRLLTVPAKNRQFAGWYEDGKLAATRNPLYFNVKKEGSLVAKYIHTDNVYYVDARVYPLVGGYGDPAGWTQPQGGIGFIGKINYTVRATPSMKYEFSHWSDFDDPDPNAILSTEPSYTFYAERDYMLVANFKPRK